MSVIAYLLAVAGSCYLAALTRRLRAVERFLDAHHEKIEDLKP